VSIHSNKKSEKNQEILQWKIHFCNQNFQQNFQKKRKDGMEFASLKGDRHLLHNFITFVTFSAGNQSNTHPHAVYSVVVLCLCFPQKYYKIQ
jgi:hypothetical protein